MSESEPGRVTPRISKAAARRIRAGSKRGAAMVSERFAEAVTRRRYCELVGIHATTLRRWEAAAIVRPTKALILNSPTHVFTAEDVELGRSIVELLAASPGRLSLRAAADAARADSEFRR